MKVTPENWPTVSRLLDEALDRPVSEREHWFAQLPLDCRGLEPILRNLLTKHALAQTSGLLAELPGFIVASQGESGRVGFEPGALIGRYRLVRLLGQGGMAEVWLATRSDGELERTVALKLPHAHLLAGAVRPRFERERDILAALSHPHIAPLFDAGVSEGGHPYLAMEWIDGVPITQHCRDARLPVDERLVLFRQVLDAVHYAHTRFIAHRDLKPSNILVTYEGAAKLLDFGVAKLLSADAAGGETELTRISGRAITPDYASPEQLAGGPVTMAVDVYSLGVVLFELLAGVRPFDRARRAHDAGQEAPLASQRATDAQVRKLLQGDLDAIIAKSLDPDPAQRYRSVAAFSDDLQRYRQREPVSARHIGRLVTLARLARRYRLATVLIAGLVVTLIGGASAVAWQAVAARRAAARAELTKNFLIDVFKASDPRIPADKPRGTITAKELLDASSSHIEQQFHDDPETQIELLGTSAEIYKELGERPRYLALHQKQMEVAKQHYGEVHPIFINGLLDEADDSIQDTNIVAANRLLGRAASLVRRGGLAHSAMQARWLLEKGRALQNDASARPQRIAVLRDSISLYEKVAPTDRDYVSALNELGLAYCDADDFAHATEFHAQAVAVIERVWGRGEADLGTSYSNLGLDRWYVGDYAGAERAMARSAEITLATVGEEDERYWATVVPYAKVIHQRGDRERAHRLFEQLVRQFPAAAQRQLNAHEQTTMAYAREVQAACWAIEGRPQAAIPALEAALETYRRLPSVEYDLRRVRLTLGDVYDLVGREDDARRELQGALEDYTAHEAPDSIVSLKARERWGRFLLKTGDLKGADEQFRRVLDLDHHRNLAPTALAYGGLAQIALARRDASVAKELSGLGVSTFEHATGMRDIRTGPYLWRIHADALLLAGDRRAAGDWARRALDADRRYDDPSSKDIADAEATLRAVQAAGITADRGG